MTGFRNYVVIFMVVFLTGCSSISVREDYNPQTDFSLLKTYDWAQETKDSGMNDLDMARVREAVNSHLSAKGYTKRSDNPDFLITVYLVKKDPNRVPGTDVSVNSATFSFSGRTGNFDDELGALILNFSDPKSNALFWQGSAGGVLKALKTPERRQERTNEIVTRILNQFPPG